MKFGSAKINKKSFRKMDSRVPKNLLTSKYRKEMWRNGKKILGKLEKALPISSIHLMGSFTTNKKRPADMDFIVLLKVKEKDANAKWAIDVPLVPDNKYGQLVLEDAKKWMKQKYGSKKSAVIRLK